MVKKIILASQSPRRVELLAQMGVECVVMPADIDESVLPGESPANYVQRLAKEKAQAIARVLKAEHEHLPILGADTTVVCNDKILGKPRGAADATAMLKMLSGKVHVVHTAVALGYQSKWAVALNSTQVEMMRLSDAMIESYISSGEYRDKAGAYGIQGLAGNWIKRIDGSYSGVMGLPVHETYRLLNSMEN